MDFAILGVYVDFFTSVVFSHLGMESIFRKEMEKIRATFYYWKMNWHRFCKESR